MTVPAPVVRCESFCECLVVSRQGRVCDSLDFFSFPQSVLNLRLDSLCKNMDNPQQVRLAVFLVLWRADTVRCCYYCAAPVCPVRLLILFIFVLCLQF